VAATVEEGEGDEVVGVGEPVGDTGQDPDLGVRRYLERRRRKA